MTRRQFFVAGAALLGSCACGAAWLACAAPTADGAIGGASASDEGFSSSDGTLPEQGIRGDAEGDVAAPVDTAGLSRDDWRLTLVNPTHAIDPAYQVPLAVTSDGRLVDERCLPDVERLMEACRAAGFNPYICSAYRTQETQESLFDNHMQNLLAQGYSGEEARAQTATVVATPGTSEHQLGLALDIVDERSPELTAQQEDTPTQQWLMEHCWEYGFILRYPTDKSELTGIVYEPWHYRYVGEEAAREVHRLNICLEEFLG